MAKLIDETSKAKKLMMKKKVKQKKLMTGKAKLMTKKK
jgi:hypothetical protein